MQIPIKIPTGSIQEIKYFTVAILELIRGAQYLIEVIRSSGEEM
jgi:hypothetical protein